MWYIYGALFYAFILGVILTIKYEYIKNSDNEINIFGSSVVSVIWWPVSVVLLCSVAAGLLIKKTFFGRQ
jgi:ribose/xylose/arabinose/galactoside ABC-type transport system permease subunit